jgi:uncharacterized protein
MSLSALDTFAEAEMSFGGAAFVAEPMGGLYWPDELTLLVADLHLEKCSTQARRGVLLPPYDSHVTLSRLSQLIARFRPKKVVALGDSFHDRHGPDRLDASCCEQLNELQRGRDWLWLTGNHDPEIADRVGGSVASDATIAGLTLRHEPSAHDGFAGAEIAGHLHPVARLLRRGVVIRRPCFFCTPNRLVLPAFGAYTGGLNVLDAAFAPLLDPVSGPQVWMCGQDGVYGVSPRHLQPG